MTARVAVVGGGITGLAAAWELHRAGHAPVVLESGDRFGGKIRTSSFAGLAGVDEAADAFLARVPNAIELATELGMSDTLVAPATGSAFVSHGGRLHPIPAGLVLGVPAGWTGLARSLLLSWPGKLRATLDVVLPARSTRHDSLGRTIRDRFGDEVLERLVDPLVGSINAGDSDTLSLAASTPQIADVAGKSRSLLLGLRRAPASGTGPVFLAPRDGMSSLVERLVADLGRGGVELRRSTPVGSIEPDGRVGHLVDGEPFDAVILAVPAFASAALLRPCAPDAADLLDGVPYAGVVMVTLAVPAEELRHVPAGSGYLVPKPEQAHVTAVSFASRKWAHLQPPDGTEILRVSLGRYRHEAALDLDDDAVLAAAVGETSRHLGLRTELAPTRVRITRWANAFPQYLPHHLDRVAAIERAIDEVSPRLTVAGAAQRGIGIPACIRQGRSGASALTQRLDSLRE